MEIHGERVVLKSSEAEWLQQLRYARDIIDVRQQVLAARRAYAAQFVPALGEGRMTIQEAQQDIRPWLALGRETAKLRDVETEHGTAPDGSEHHIIELSLTASEKHRLLSIARISHDDAREQAVMDRSTHDAAVDDTLIWLAEQNELEPGAELELFEVMRPASKYREALESGMLSGQLQEIAVTAGIITALSADQAMPD